MIAYVTFEEVRVVRSPNIVTDTNVLNKRVDRQNVPSNCIYIY